MVTFDLGGYDVRGSHSRIATWCLSVSSHVVIWLVEVFRKTSELLAQVVQCLDDSGGTS